MSSLLPSLTLPTKRWSLWCAALALLLLGCGQKPTDETLRFGLATAPASLDPRFASDANAARLCRLLYATLVDFDVHFRPVPALADWARLSPLHYRFRLREARRFDDGTVLRADDVVATYQAILDPARGSPLRSALAHIAQVEAVDLMTIDFHLTRSDPLFPGLLTVGILRARDARLLTLSQQPIGSGNFRLYAPFDTNRVPLERRRDGQRVDFIVVPNESTRALKLLRGELDLAQGGFAPELTDWLSHQLGITVTRYPGTVFSYLGFNLADGPTANPLVRGAIARAIDREQILKFVFRQYARVANTILVPEHWAGNPDLKPVSFDPRAARALLTQAGYGPNNPLRLSYKTSNDYFRRRLATILQDQLRHVGIELAIQTYDWGTFYGDIKEGRFQMYGLSWVGLQLPDIFRQAFHSTAAPPHGANRGRYQSQVIDRLIEQAEAASTELARVALYREIETQLLVDLPYVPLWFEDSVVVQGARVGGYDTDLEGHFDGLNKTVHLRR